MRIAKGTDSNLLVGLATILHMAPAARRTTNCSLSALRLWSTRGARDLHEAIAFNNDLGGMMIQSPVLFREYQAMNDFNERSSMMNRDCSLLAFLLAVAVFPAVSHAGGEIEPETITNSIGTKFG